MKAVMLSLRPQWCEKIFNGSKTIEVRKSRPSLDMPFKVYVYMTKRKWIFKLLPFLKNRFAKVIGEFVCNDIDEIRPCIEYYTDDYDIDDDSLSGICMTREQLREYGKGNSLYGWHISDLKIYDKPKELGEFRKPCDFAYDCCVCQRAVYKQLAAGEMIFNGCNDKITRPPQSWCYVEEL